MWKNSGRERQRLQSNAWLTDLRGSLWSVPGTRCKQWPKPENRRGRLPFRKQPFCTGALSVSSDSGGKNAGLKKMIGIASALLGCRSSRKRSIEENIFGSDK